ncbi:glycosyltransferase family 4 protein [Labilibacter sediminis]|nr:glycosyltransferase family 4 protein [Labilibacter sediminis]
MRKKIVWVIHNKKPHRVKSKLALYCMWVAARSADIIICHANEGKDFVKVKYGGKASNKVRYVPHPVYSTELYEPLPEKWDIVIWGTIARYKNIAQFLEFVKESPKFSAMKILICGFCPDKEYEKEIQAELTPNISYLNRFLTDEELKHELRSTKAILFTYKLDSVLSSGAMVYSLNFNKKIIGPKGGAFEDLQPIVTCYESFNDLEQVEFNDKVSDKCIGKYLAKNTWGEIPSKIIKHIES